MFVKFICKEGIRFKAGTEALYQDSFYIRRRMTLREYNLFKISVPVVEFFGEFTDTIGGESRMGIYYNFDKFNIEIVNEDHRSHND